MSREEVLEPAFEGDGADHDVRDFVGLVQYTDRLTQRRWVGDLDVGQYSTWLLNQSKVCWGSGRLLTLLRTSSA